MHPSNACISMFSPVDGGHHLVQDDAEQQAAAGTDPRTRRVSSGQLTPDEGLSRDEVFRRLRALGQPVTLFGEVRSPELLS